MKIGIKPMKGGDPFEVEVAPDESLDSLKLKIATIRPELPIDTQKLVCSGKVLSDGGARLQDLGVKDGDFIVVMAAKAKETAAAPMLPGYVPEASTAAAAPAQDAVAQAPVAAPADPSGFQEMVQNLCEIGFPKAEVEKCLRAAFMNPDRAVEYLTTGIPASAQARSRAPQPAAPAQPPVPVPGSTVPASGSTAPSLPAPLVGPPLVGPGGGTGPLAHLRLHPRFNEFKTVVQHKPEVLNQVLGVWTAHDPNLLQLIAEHQEDFVAMLQEPVAPPPGGARGGAADPVAAMIAAAAAQAGGGAAPGSMPAPTGQAATAPPPQPQLTDVDKQAIQNLMSFGFTQQQVMEAYLSCDKNEEMAASLLFDSMEEA